MSYERATEFVRGLYRDEAVRQELNDALEQVAGGKSADSNIAASVMSGGITCAISSIVGAAEDGQTCEGKLKGNPTVTREDR